MRRSACVALLLLLLGGACGGEVPVTEAELEPATSPPVYTSAPTPDGGVEPGVRTGGGSLPIGYNERHCQWDACDPPPQRPEPLRDPVADRLRPERP